MFIVVARRIAGRSPLLCQTSPRPRAWPGRVNQPAIMTRGSVPKEVREAGRVTDNLIRLSVGVEDLDELIADLNQALG